MGNQGPHMGPHGVPWAPGLPGDPYGAPWDPKFSGYFFGYLPRFSFQLLASGSFFGRIFFRLLGKESRKTWENNPK